MFSHQINTSKKKGYYPPQRQKDLLQACWRGGGLSEYFDGLILAMINKCKTLANIRNIMRASQSQGNPRDDWSVAFLFIGSCQVQENQLNTGRSDCDNHLNVSSTPIEDCRDYLRDFAQNTMIASRVTFESILCKKGLISKLVLAKWLRECMEQLKDYDEISIHFIGDSFKPNQHEYIPTKQHNVQAEKVNETKEYHKKTNSNGSQNMKGNCRIQHQQSLKLSGSLPNTFNESQIGEWLCKNNETLSQLEILQIITSSKFKNNLVIISTSDDGFHLWERYQKSQYDSYLSQLSSMLLITPFPFVSNENQSHHQNCILEFYQTFSGANINQKPTKQYPSRFYFSNKNNCTDSSTSILSRLSTELNLTCNPHIPNEFQQHRIDTPLYFYCYTNR